MWKYNRKNQGPHSKPTPFYPCADLYNECPCCTAALAAVPHIWAWESGEVGIACFARFVIPGQAQHVIQQGNNKDITFVTDYNYRFCLDRLRQSSERADHGESAPDLLVKQGEHRVEELRTPI